jgi:hypothetical protein
MQNPITNIEQFTITTTLTYHPGSRSAMPGATRRRTGLGHPPVEESW